MRRLSLLDVCYPVAQDVFARREQIRIRLSSMEEGYFVVIGKKLINNRPPHKLRSAENKDIHGCSMKLRTS